MSVDQAFDNLMQRNALAIPMAAGGNGEGERKKRPGTDSVMRVANLLEDGGEDFRSGGGSAEGDPSETDSGREIDLADLPEDVASAYLHGARIVSRDTEELHTIDMPQAGGLSQTRTFSGGRTTGAAQAMVGAQAVSGTRMAGGAQTVGDARTAGGTRTGAEGSGVRFEARLESARRVRRFSYLPLSGMDIFEADAREMAVKLAALDPGRPSLVISSAKRGEGRTELAIRLALALAKRVDHKVLLVDFDLRNPQAAVRLGVSSKHFTLTDVLRGACPLADALTVSEEDNLYLLPSRSLDRDGDEILDSRQAEGLFAELHQTFDFIIIDCGPVNRAEAAIVCRLAGFAVLAGFCGVTAAGELNRAGALLETAGARVAGMLLTGGKGN